MQRRGVASHPFAHQSQAISILPSAIDVSSSDFQQNVEQMNQILAELEDLHKRTAKGGSPKAREKHIARKKMLPRE